MINQKGQAFSTFKLLIAAIVAIAILTILLQVIGTISPLGQQDPGEEAIQQLKSYYNRPSEHKLTGEVFFDPEDSLNGKAIAQSTGILSPDQVCISAGDFSEKEELFEEDSDLKGRSLVTYNGSSSFATKLSIICDTAGELGDDLKASGLEENYLSSCTSNGICTNEDRRCCIIVLRAA